jgi:hypothetical protein
MEFPVMSRASGSAPGCHRFAGTATGAMARMFAAWSRVRRSKQPAAYAGRAYGSEEPQVTALSAHAAGMMRVGDSDCGPEGPGRLRRAADGQ